MRADVVRGVRAVAFEHREADCWIQRKLPQVLHQGSWYTHRRPCVGAGIRDPEIEKKSGEAREHRATDTRGGGAWAHHAPGTNVGRAQGVGALDQVRELPGVL